MVSSLHAILGRDWLTEHVGSTSVPGLLAKPVIDIAVRVPAGTSRVEATGLFDRTGWTTPAALGDHLATFLLTDGVRTGIGHILTHEPNLGRVRWGLWLGGEAVRGMIGPTPRDAL